MTVTMSNPMKTLEEHPYVQSLMNSKKYEISYPYHDVGEEREEYSLTAGLLIGDGRISPSPMTLTLKRELIDQTGECEMFIFYHLGPKICGHKNIIHGGLLATLLDESLCRCGFQVLPNKVGVTASLNIKYCSPTPADSFVVLKAKTTKLDGRKVWVEGSTNVLPEADQYNADDEFVVGTKAELLAIQPKWADKLTERGQPEATN